MRLLTLGLSFYALWSSGFGAWYQRELMGLINLMFKNIAEQKSSVGDAKIDLFCKIVMGDTSDNIPSVLSKCGPKTALKCYHDKAYFDERMKKENAYDKWTKNQLLVDFNYIPQHLIDEFMLNIDQYF